MRPRVPPAIALLVLALLGTACVTPRSGSGDRDDDVGDDDDSAGDDDDSAGDDDDSTGDDDDSTGDDDDSTGDDDDATGADPCSSGGSGGSTGTSTGSAGGASYTIHAPTSAPSPAPVLFTQHGQGGTGGQMVDLWATDADAGGFIVVGQDSQGEGWNFNGDVSGLDAILTAVSAQHDVDLCRVYLHGYSAGAHQAYVVGLANANIFAGLAVNAGAMSYAVDLGVWPGSVPRPIGVRIDHGTQDTVVSYGFAEQAADWLSGAGHPVELVPAVGAGHGYDPSLQPAVWSTLSGWSLSAPP